MPKLRLASALLIPAPVATEIDGLRRACGDAMFGRVDAHVTLVEPINVREEALGAVEDVMRDAAAAVAGPITLTFGPARVVPPRLAGAVPRGRRRPRRAHGPPRCDAHGPFRAGGSVAVRPPRHDRHRPLGGSSATPVSTALTDYSVSVTLSHVQVLQEMRDPDEVRRWRPIADAALGGRSVSGRGGIELEVTEAAGSACTLTARHDGARRRGAAGLGRRRARPPRLARRERRRPRARRRPAAARGLRGPRASPGSVTARRLTAGLDARLLRARGWRDEGGAVVRDV